MEFNETEYEILRRVQGNLPDSPTPYADIAVEVSRVTGNEVLEEDVLALLQDLKDRGVIRRFGATLKHQKAGYAANVMVGWAMSEEEIMAKGPVMAAYEHVSHCYFRRPQKDWRYGLFTMVHGASMEECKAHVERMSRETDSHDYALLKSVRELKKTSMVYFA